MKQGLLTDREQEIIHYLLVKKGIRIYEIVQPSNEGKQLPGSLFPLEVETVSGLIVTPTAIYIFWLDWFEGRYTLGEHRDFWHKVELDDFSEDMKEQLREIQQYLREEEAESTHH